MTERPTKKTAAAARPAVARAAKEPTDQVDQAAAEAVEELRAQTFDPDPRDALLAELRAELEALRNPPEPEPEDPKDAAIRQLREEIAAVREGREVKRDPLDMPEDDIRRAFAELTRQFEELKRGQGVIPLPEPTEPDPDLYVAVLATGETVDVPHPHATHHHSEQLGAVVPIVSYFPIPQGEAAAA